MSTSTTAGFTGTIPQFIEWVADQLEYGGVTVSEVQRSEFGNHDVRLVRMVTGGWSDDEHLLSRVRRSAFGTVYWSSSHSGGLTVYEVPVDTWEWTAELEWITEDSDVFQSVDRARHIVVRDEDGRETRFEVTHGAQLRYEEEDTEDPRTPRGTLILEPVPESASIWRELD